MMPARCDKVAMCRFTTSILLVAAAGCVRPQIPTKEAAARLPADLQQALVMARCDTDAYYALANALHRRRDISVAGPDLVDSQLHDCQRLITNNTLGPVVGLLVATHRVELPTFTSGVVVAEIINYSGSAYAELGIEPGLNCLWLQGDAVANPDGTHWVAGIVQPAPGGNCVTAAPERPSPGQTLTVTRLTYDGNVYPSTGRWMWDRQNQFIGIRCGSGWCEMGRPGSFTSTTVINTTDDVPGWYDEQLMSYAPQAGAPLQLSQLLGRISPAPGLRDAPDQDFRTPPGLHVATLQFTGNDPAALDAYRQKFDMGPAETMARIVHLQDGSQLTYTLNGTNWRTVFFNKHARHAGRGAVRWSWNERDEEAWYSCPMGCCTTDALDDM
jgi:hypothetical protein